MAGGGGGAAVAAGGRPAVGWVRGRGVVADQLVWRRRSGRWWRGGRWRRMRAARRGSAVPPASGGAGGRWSGPCGGPPASGTASEAGREAGGAGAAEVVLEEEREGVAGRLLPSTLGVGYEPPLFRQCYGAYDSRDPLDKRPPKQCCDLGPASLSASPPSSHPRSGHRMDAPMVHPASVLPPACHISTDTSVRRALQSLRGSDISPVPSTRPPPRRERYHKQHRHARDESSHSPHVHLPLRGSKSLPSSKRYQSEYGHEGSKSLPSSKRYQLDLGRNASSSSVYWYDDSELGGSRSKHGKRYRLDQGHNASSSSTHCYNDNERYGNRDKHGNGGNTQDVTCPSSYDHGYNSGLSKNNNNQWYHGKESFGDQCYSLPTKLPLPMPVEMSPWDDGYKNPTSPIDLCEDMLDTRRCMHDEYGTQKFSLDEGPHSALVACAGLDAARREPHFKYEDPMHRKKKEDSAYGALVDDFMDAVLKNWRKPVSPDPTLDKGAHQKQANRYAELALKRYNNDKNNKVKYSLVEALVSASIFEDSKLYAHVNFYAHAKNGPKKNGPKELIFAELYHVGRRPNAMVLTCFRLLDEEKQLSGCRDQVRSCGTTEVEDIYHCYACSDKVKHPKGSLYKAGHVTDTLYYLND